jgi:hypothetical protein
MAAHLKTDSCPVGELVWGKVNDIVRPEQLDQIEAELGRVLWSWDHWMKTNEASFTGLRPEVRAKVESLGRLVSKAQKMLQKGQTR